jgi:CRISPR-associated endonuclease/helicase Cas3
MNDSDQRHVEASVTRIWAKTNSGTCQWHPLLYHLVETSATASLLWDEILAPSTHKVIADALGLPLDEARQWSLFLVGAHDLGKASPSFQCKWAPSVLPLQQLGYRFPVNVMPIPHGRVSSIALARILEARGVERRVANEIARAVGGHHGVFDTASALQQSSPQAVGEGLWEESRKWIIDLTCPLKTNPNLERESKDSGVCKEAGNDEEAIHERTDYPQAEGSRS